MEFHSFDLNYAIEAFLLVPFVTVRHIHPLYYLSNSNLQQSLKQVKQIKQIKQTKESKENKKYISGCSVDILKGNSSVEHITSHSVKDTFGFTS